jgi:hypothetical protein
MIKRSRDKKWMKQETSEKDKRKRSKKSKERKVFKTRR